MDVGMYEGKTHRIWKAAGKKRYILERSGPKLLSQCLRSKDVGSQLNWTALFEVRDPTHIDRIPLVLAVP